jgi:phosphoglucomutase
MVVMPTAGYAQMAAMPEFLPPPGTMVTMTPAYIPAIIKGITIDPQNPLHFNFIIDTGDSKLQGEELATESRRLIKYFLATLTTPERDLWVNLSPYEKDRIIPEAFGVTEMGRDLLAQDYILKQLTASLMYPEKELGQTFWDKVYAKAQSLYGKTDIPVDTFNKVWIVPETASLYEQGNTVLIVESHLKVMLEEDYIALQNAAGEAGSLDAIRGYEKSDSKVASEVIRDLIIPEIEKEVNTGKTFAKLRQIYNSMILATWYKTNLRESLLGQVYVDKNKIAGVDIEDRTEKDKIYEQYLQAFKTGVYNYIKEEYDPETQEVIPKKYFSGGMKFGGQISTVVRSFNQNNVTPQVRQKVVESMDKSGIDATIQNIDVILQDFGTDARESAVRALENINRENSAMSVVEARELTPVAVGNVNSRPVKFGTSGDRGQFTRDFTPQHKRRINQGIADYFNEAAAGKTMYLGYDPRQDNAEATKDAAAIYAANGIKTRVVASEPTAVPVLAFLTNNDSNAGGMTVFTASHSPYTDGGIKFSPEHGGAAASAITDAITDYANEAESFKTVDYETAKSAGLIEEMSPEEVQRQYVDNYVVPKLKELGAWDDMVNFLRNNQDFELVVDAMQGASGRYLEAIYSQLAQAVGRQFYTIINKENSDPTFSNVNREPNPSKEKSRAGLTNEVRSRNRAMGLSVDADADRFGAVDTNGQFMSANDQIALMAYFLKKEIGLDGAIGKTVATSNFVNAVANKLNTDLDEEAVGFKNFVRKTTDEGRQYLVAGEESSHVAVGPFMQSWDDGIVVGLMTFWMAARTGQTLTQYKDSIQRDLDQKFMIETMTYRGQDDSIKDVVNQKIAQTNQELNDGVAVSDLSLVRELEAAGTPKVVDIINKDGVKLVFETGDWMLMRPSGTEPAVKFYVEVAAPYSADAQQMSSTFNNLKSIGEVAIGVAASADNALRSTNNESDEDGLHDSAARELRFSVARRHESIHKPWLQRLTTQVRNELVSAQQKYETAKYANNAAAMKEAEDEINRLVDQVNVNENIADAMRRGELKMPEINGVEAFKSLNGGSTYQEYNTKAEQRLLSGNYVPQFLFAGKATRLGRGAMYTIDIWDIADELGVAKGGNYRFGLGPRQLIAFRMKLEDVARRNGADIAQVLNNQKLVFNINDEVEQNVIDDMINQNFYGFNPQNIYFINQPEFTGKALDSEGNLSDNLDSKPLVYGHGDNAAQFTATGEAFQIDSRGSKTYLSGDLLEYVGDRQIETHRINDMTKLDMNTVWNADTEALRMYLHDQGYDVVVDLVENPTKAKGGTPSNMGLIETLAAKGSSYINDYLAQMAELGSPYNSFRLSYGQGESTLRPMLEKGLRYYLRFKDGFYYLESVTGDLTQIPGVNVAYIKQEGAVIRDFKENKNVPMAVDFLREQERQMEAAGITPAGYSRILTSEANQINESIRDIGRIENEEALRDYLNSDDIVVARAAQSRLNDIRRDALSRQADTVRISTGSENVGGIDLNPALLDIQIKRDGNGVPLPLPQQPIQNMHIHGFMPVIINITPLSNMPLLLGMANTGDPEISRYSSDEQWMDNYRY